MEVKDGYKQTEVGVIPQHWDVRKLNKISQMQSGESITAKDISQRDVYPCYGGNGLRGYTSSFTHNGEFALIGRQGALCGNVLYVTGSFYASEHAVVVTANDDTDTKWLSYILISLKLNRYSESSAQPGLSVTKVGQLPIPIPPLSEQKAISTALSDTDRLIDSLTKLIEKKKRIKQGAMQELLTGKRRLEGFRPEVVKYKQTEAGVFPKEWAVNTINELDILIDSDNLKSDTSPNRVIKYVSLEDVRKGKLIGFTELKFEYAPSRARRKIKKGDVLISTVRPGLQSHYYVKHEVADLICSTGFSVLRANQSVFCGEYLYHHFFGEIINRQIEAILVGTSYPAINNSDIKKLIVPIPPLLEQQTIAKVLSDMDNEIAVLENKLAKYKDVKEGMMQELLTGRIRLVEEAVLS